MKRCLLQREKGFVAQKVHFTVRDKLGGQDRWIYADKGSLMLCLFENEKWTDEMIKLCLQENGAQLYESEWMNNNMKQDLMAR